MNLREIILEEHSKKQAMRIVKWVGADKKRFAELVKIFLGNEYRVTQRAAWPLSICVEAHPELVKPHLGKLIRNLAKENLHPAVQRNTLRLLQFVEIPEKYMGTLVDTCFGFLLRSDATIASKVFSMTVLVHIAKKEPGLKREIQTVITEQMKEGSAGIRARGKNTLKELEKIA